MLPFIDDAKKQVLDAFNAWKNDWTQGRAVKLDNLDVPVSSRARLPLYEDYDIKHTAYTPLTNEPLEFLNVSGEAVLIGYSINLPPNSTENSDSISIEISVDGSLMYGMDHTSLAGVTYHRTRNAFSSFDDNFLFNVYGYSEPNLFHLGCALLPNDETMVLDDSAMPAILVVPPISKNRLIVEASRFGELTRNVRISIIYGVKK